jgi:LysM repeat protein
MKKVLYLAVILSLVGLVACQRAKPTVILPKATGTPALAGTLTPILSPTATPTSTSTPTPAPTPTPITHIVAFGESISSIARMYGVEPEALAEANGIAPPYVIYAGQALIIPVTGGAPAPTTTAGPRTYVVEYGETCSSIALKFGVDVQALAEANGLQPSCNIQAGQELIIP